MRTDAPRRLLAELRHMASRGRHSDGRPVGATLAARLPMIIAAVADLLERGRRTGGHAHG